MTLGEWHAPSSAEECGWAMSKSKAGSLEREGAEALALMKQALKLVDSFEASAEIGAHLDLAISRLRNALRDARGRPSD
jgi:hypothetical protein